jgi:hypothetical protein
MLMRSAEQGLEVLGCPKVNLQARATNTAVILFCRSLGYDVGESTSLGKRLGAAYPFPASSALCSVSTFAVQFPQ